PNPKSNKEIPAPFFISQKTVKTHLSNLLPKLQLPHPTQPPLFPLKYNLNPHISKSTSYS
ncbi:LuxR C-terminal-related transcriptional regulator, partial [Bacillus subtilis]|uniref:LuxR C-terminal-related transcriptional regulator n=1 Tax=Bacillus subtilis TaxID=1423 RepID=UPI001BDB9B83